MEATQDLSSDEQEEKLKLQRAIENDNRPNSKKGTIWDNANVISKVYHRVTRRKKSSSKEPSRYQSVENSSSSSSSGYHYTTSSEHTQSNEHDFEELNRQNVTSTPPPENRIFRAGDVHHVGDKPEKPKPANQVDMEEIEEGQFDDDDLVNQTQLTDSSADTVEVQGVPDMDPNRPLSKRDKVTLNHGVFVDMVFS